MTWPLGDLMETVRLALGAVTPEQISDGDRETASWYYGARFLRANNRRPPSYCWFPGDISPAAPFKGDLGANRAVATGAEVALVHIWGLDDEQAWTLRHNLIAAAKDEYGPDCDYLGCQRFEPDDQGYGLGYITKLSFNIPVIGEVLSIAVPATLDHSGYIVIDGVATLACGD